MIVTLDGSAGTGKSTLAKRLARALGFSCFDTGAMYRSLAWKLLEEKIAFQEGPELDALLARFAFRVDSSVPHAPRFFVGDEEVTTEIRAPHISTYASRVAAFPSARKALVQIQRAFGAQGDVVFEGRDIGTIIFPSADVKFFLTARSDVRAKRRYEELLQKFPDLSLTLSAEQILEEIEQRDRQDINRSCAPLRKPEGAVEIDTSDHSIDEILSKMVRIVEERRKPVRIPCFYRFVRGLAWTFFRVFYRLKVYGLHHVRRGRAIIAPNHASNFDPPVVSACCPHEVQFLAKASLFEVPILGWVIRKLNSHPVARGGSDAAVFRQLIQLLQEEKKVVLFPEGQRSDSGELQPLEKGLAFLAYKSHSRILPAYVSGTAEIWGPKRRFPRLRGRVACAFGSPIEWEEFANLERAEAIEQITARCDQALRKLKTWMEAGAIGEPP